MLLHLNPVSIYWILVNALALGFLVSNLIDVHSDERARKAEKVNGQVQIVNRWSFWNEWLWVLPSFLGIIAGILSLSTPAAPTDPSQNVFHWLTVIIVLLYPHCIAYGAWSRNRLRRNLIATSSRKKLGDALKQIQHEVENGTCP